MFIGLEFLKDKSTNETIVINMNAVKYFKEYLNDKTEIIFINDSSVIIDESYISVKYKLTPRQPLFDK